MLDVNNIGKRGIVGENITDILLWIIFLILGAFAVWFVVKQLTA